MAVFALGFSVSKSLARGAYATRKKDARGIDMAGPVLELRNLNKEIWGSGEEPFVIFKNINLTVREGEFVSIVGPSGCGKTTLLRVINGLMSHSGGQILIDGKSAEEVNQELLMGFVFPGASLLPWRTSLKNVLLGVEGRGENAKETEQSARKHLELVGLAGFENYYPRQLSGGMQQRVNLAARWRSIRAFF